MLCRRDAYSMGPEALMGRGLAKRIIAAAILISFGCLSLLAIAPALFGMRLDDLIRRRMADHSTVSLDLVGPLRISAAPDIILAAGRAKIIGALGASSKTIELSDVLFNVESTALTEAAMEQSTTELTSMFGGATAIRILNGSIDLRAGGTSIAVLSNVDATLALKGERVGHLRGQASYRGQVVKFDIGTTGRSTIDGVKTEWPLRVQLSSPSFEATANGVFDIGEVWSFSGETEAKTKDAAKLAAWLAQSWSGAETGSAFLIKGPMTWANGAITFGKSRVSLGDQDGVGAVSLSLRDRRPLIEAALAFEALDVTSILYGKPPTETAKEGWRLLATNFPAARSVDADLRLSAARLQWRGDPVGKAAFSISAKGGLIHADVAELALGSFFGNLQLVMDEREARVPVVLRARLHAPNAGAMSERIFGGPIIAGAATAQFELSGQGLTLGEVVDRSNGRGTLDARDGQLNIALAAVQKLLAAPTKPSAPGWGPIAGNTAYQTIAAKLQMRNGAILIDEATVRSSALTAYANGRLGLVPSEVDIKLRVEPTRGDGQGTLSAEQRAGLPVTANPRAPQTTGSLSITGGWSSPVLTVVPDGSVP